MSDAYLKRWSPELRRAVMRVRPEFFAWPQERRERYGVEMPEEDSDRLDQALLSELFGKTYDSPREASNAAAELPLSLLNHWNETRQPLIGIGEDCFFLNDHVPNKKTILDFPTLRALDETDYACQESYRKRDDSTYTAKPYRGALYLGWARMYLDDKFVYATLSMAAGYIFSELEAHVSDVVKERVPYREVPGTDHGKREGDSWRWDLRKEAGGQEELVEELNHRAIHHVFARFDALREHWHSLRRCGVYILEAPDPPDPLEFGRHFVFTDVQALEAVRFRSFVRDCHAMELPAAEIEEAVRIEKAQLATWIAEQHEELLETFDPKVAKLRKRYKIMIHKDAFKDFE